MRKPSLMPIKQDGTDLMAQSENEQWSSKRFLDDSLWYELESERPYCCIKTKYSYLSHLVSVVGSGY